MRARYAVLSIFMGCALILGGPTRISATAYMVVNATGGAYVWGSTLLIIGAVIAVMPRKSLRWALLGAGAGYAVFAMAFAAAAYASPTSNFTAPVVYAWVAMLHALASEKVREELSWMPPSLRSSVQV